MAEIELLAMETPKESWEMDGFDEKLEAALRRKNDGNAYFSKVLYLGGEAVGARG